MESCSKCGADCVDPDYCLQCLVSYPEPGCLAPPETRWQRFKRKVKDFFGIGTITVTATRVEIPTYPIDESAIKYKDLKRRKL